MLRFVAAAAAPLWGEVLKARRAMREAKAMSRLIGGEGEGEGCMYYKQCSQKLQPSHERPPLLLPPPPGKYRPSKNPATKHPAPVIANE